MEPRAWVGINLGRSLLSPGAYHVWVPSVPRVVTTSDVYFDEGSYPWLPQLHHAATSPASPVTDSGADQPPGLPPREPPADPSLGHTIETATLRHAPAHDSRT
eukprot:873201-Pleurochrysis_carterae.AAC.1